MEPKRKKPEVPRISIPSNDLLNQNEAIDMMKSVGSLRTISNATMKEEEFTLFTHHKLEA